MTDLASSLILFTGSVPEAGEEAVFRRCASLAGNHVFALPDGEIGERAKWAGCLGPLTYRLNPDLEPTNPADHDVPSGSLFRDMGLQTYRIKEGVDKPQIDNFPYADAAVRSYQMFVRLREAGDVPPGVRFQVAIPTSFAGVRAYFPEFERWPQIFEAVEDGLRGQIAKVLEVVPADDLVLQLDYCSEIVDGLAASDAGDQERAEEIRRRYTTPEYLSALTKDLPDEVIFGYHLCLGTFYGYGGWPSTSVPDMSFVTQLSNVLVAHTPHRVDYLHLPVMSNADESFFAPLRDLDVGDARIFLGLETGDGAEELMRRVRAARTVLPSFGIGHYCGYGRDDAQRVPQLIRDLRGAADELAAT
jgi:hypothetical protein